MLKSISKLFYNTDVGALTAILATFTVGLFGYVLASGCNLQLIKTYRLRYGLVGLLRPLIVYPSEMVYWGVSIQANLCSYTTMF